MTLLLDEIRGEIEEDFGIMEGGSGDYKEVLHV